MKRNKGITLIALIITIIVLLILAVVSIRAIQGDGIIAQAKRVRNEYSIAQLEEKSKLQAYEDFIDVNIGKILKIQDIQGITITENTKVIDEYGNKFVVPAGFKITQDASHVNEGVVIEDVSAGDPYTVGSQFVWVPVGKVYTDIEKTEANSKTIELKRYIFNNDGTINEEHTTIDTEYFVNNTTRSYIEGLKNQQLFNKQAKDIEGFRASVATNGGYYMGRYEASKCKDISI